LIQRRIGQVGDVEFQDEFILTEQGLPARHVSLAIEGVQRDSVLALVRAGGAGEHAQARELMTNKLKERRP
jgi:hypothetical protein